MIYFEFRTSQGASQTLLEIPKVQLVAGLEDDFFELDFDEAKKKLLPENFYLQEAAILPQRPSIDFVSEFISHWGMPTHEPSRGMKVRVKAQTLSREVSSLGQLGRFANGWFESETQLAPPDRLLRLMERCLSAFGPRVNVSGAADNVAGVLEVCVAQWADDVINGRNLKICEFCGKRFTKQRGRSTSGRYRMDGQTKFCSHSCSNRAGNRRRRIERSVQ